MDTQINKDELKIIRSQLQKGDIRTIASNLNLGYDHCRNVLRGHSSNGLVIAEALKLIESRPKISDLRRRIKKILK